MRDISWKKNTLRVATAEAIVKMSPETLKVVTDNTGPKKDIIPIARAAGFLAVKNTPQALPHCHPLPVEHVEIDFEFGEGQIRILVTAVTIYKTGCEIEAMHGASIAALTIYDMLKPVDTDITIETIRLDSKKGGKTSFRDTFEQPLTAAVIVCSDSVSAGKKEDKAGKVIVEKLKALNITISEYTVVPDDHEAIRTMARKHISAETDLILTTGGTGLSPRDNTPEAIAPLIETDVPGIMEAARAYGTDRTPYAMLSRGVAGLNGRSLLITMPGSTNGAKETMDALFPHILHIFKVLEHGYRHGK